SRSPSHRADVPAGARTERSRRYEGLTTAGNVRGAARRFSATSRTDRAPLRSGIECRPETCNGKADRADPRRPDRVDEGAHRGSNIDAAHAAGGGQESTDRNGPRALR